MGFFNNIQKNMATNVYADLKGNLSEKDGKKTCSNDK